MEVYQLKSDKEVTYHGHVMGQEIQSREIDYMSLNYVTEKGEIFDDDYSLESECQKLSLIKWLYNTEMNI